MQNVYKWCSALEDVRSELKRTGEKERLAHISVEEMPDFTKACAQVGATCVPLGVESIKVSHHGGSYHVDKQRVRITF